MTYLTKIDMDNGSLPLAKDSLRALVKTKLSGAHRSIIDVIWLETYAWHDESSDHTEKIKKRRTHARIPYQVFVEETWMEKSVISRKLNELVDWNIIIRDKNTSPYTYSFNVHVDQWDKTIFRDTRVYRSVNSLQDSQQFTEQSTESLLDSQLGVDRTVNSLPLETPNCQGIADPLKKDKESIKESIIYIEHQAAPISISDDLFFETSWKAYPHKKGKGKIKKSQITRLNKALGLDHFLRCIERYEKDKPEWQQFMHGSTFYNSGYLDYTDANYQEQNSRASPDKMTEQDLDKLMEGW